MQGLQTNGTGHHSILGSTGYPNPSQRVISQGSGSPTPTLCSDLSTDSPNTLLFQREATTTNPTRPGHKPLPPVPATHPEPITGLHTPLPEAPTSLSDTPSSSSISQPTTPTNPNDQKNLVRGFYPIGVGPDGLMRFQEVWTQTQPSNPSLTPEEVPSQETNPTSPKKNTPTSSSLQSAKTRREPTESAVLTKPPVVQKNKGQEKALNKILENVTAAGKLIRGQLQIVTRSLTVAIQHSEHINALARVFVTQNGQLQLAQAEQNTAIRGLTPFFTPVVPLDAPLRIDRAMSANNNASSTKADRKKVKKEVQEHYQGIADLITAAQKSHSELLKALKKHYATIEKNLGKVSTLDVQTAKERFEALKGRFTALRTKTEELQNLQEITRLSYAQATGVMLSTK